MSERSRKPGLPMVANTGNLDLDRFCQGAKKTLDDMTGQASNRARLALLPATASLPEVIDRINEITRRLQD